jgi:thioredoxin-related protein
MPMLKIIEDDTEELPLYMFDFSEQMMIKHSVKRYSYKEALKKAKKENKIVMIEGYIPFCRGCIKMDREVFVEDSVKKVLNKDFVVVHENMILEKLPLGLKSLGTPSFYFITNDGKKVIDQIQGIGTVEEFLKLLHDIKEDVKRGRFFKE